MSCDIDLTLLRCRQSALSRLAAFCECTDLPDAVVVVARGEVDGDQLGCGTSPAFGEHCRHGGVRAHLGVAVLHEQRGERRQVATRFGDLQRDVGRELERLAGA